MQRLQSAEGVFRSLPRNVRQLNGLRAIAILLVMLTHMDAQLVRGGWLGVNLFFVLSGFLITSLLLDEQARSGAIAMGKFYLRRVFRLLPGLLFLIAVFIAWGAYYAPNQLHEYVREAWWALSYQADFRKHHEFPVIGLNQVWSLSVEEQFYVVWPVLVLLGTRYLRRSQMITLTTVGIAASLGVKLALFASGAGLRRLYYLPDANADLLLIGCLTAQLYSWGYLERLFEARHRTAVRRWQARALVVFLVASLVCADKRIMFVGPTTALAVVSAIMIVTCIADQTSWLSMLLATAPFVWVGELSYSLYLWHHLAYEFVTKKVWNRPPVIHNPAQLAQGLGVATLGMILAFVLAAISYYLVEKPGLRIKKRFEVERAGAPSPAETVGAPR